MIRKPPIDWQRQESGAVRTVRSAIGVARSGTRAAQSGGHVVQGLICWLIALLWTWMALIGGLFAGSMPTFIGVSLLAALMFWAGARAFRKAGEAAGLSSEKSAPATVAPTEHVDVVSDLDRVSSGEPSTAKSCPGREDAASHPQGDDFDPDAVLARYLARKQRAETAETPAAAAHLAAASSQSAARQFGRKRA